MSGDFREKRDFGKGFYDLSYLTRPKHERWFERSYAFFGICFFCSMILVGRR